jgi:hypothetical protein
MVLAIQSKEFDKGYKALVDHTDMLSELLEHHPAK